MVTLIKNVIESVEACTFCHEDISSRRIDFNERNRKSSSLTFSLSLLTTDLKIIPLLFVNNK